MTSKAVFMDDQVYQLESESEDDEKISPLVSKTKTTKRGGAAICKNSKKKVLRRGD